jgi:hypothetical protein
MAFVSERLALGMTVSLQFAMERPPGALARAGAALRLGGDAVDHAAAVDAHGVLARGTPPGVARLGPVGAIRAVACSGALT